MTDPSGETAMAGRLVFGRALRGMNRSFSTGRVQITVNTTPASTTSAAGALVDQVFDQILNEDMEGTLGTDSTGKIHGSPLPEIDDIDDDFLDLADKALSESIETRARENERFPRGNPNGSEEEKNQFEKFQKHQERIRDEQRLQEQIRRRMRQNRKSEKCMFTPTGRC